VFVALFAVAIGDARHRLVQAGLAVATACWFLGMALAVVLDRPIF
jgi:hypothetical protein